MKNASTNFGEPLSIESRKLVNELRLKINQPIHPNVSFTLLYFKTRTGIKIKKICDFSKNLGIRSAKQR